MRDCCEISEGNSWVVSLLNITRAGEALYMKFLERSILAASRLAMLVGRYLGSIAMQQLRYRPPGDGHDARAWKKQPRLEETTTLVDGFHPAIPVSDRNTAGLQQKSRNGNVSLFQYVNTLL